MVCRHDHDGHQPQSVGTASPRVQGRVPRHLLQASAGLVTARLSGAGGGVPAKYFLGTILVLVHVDAGSAPRPDHSSLGGGWVKICLQCHLPRPLPPPPPTCPPHLRCSAETWLHPLLSLKSSRKIYSDSMKTFF